MVTPGFWVINVATTILEETGGDAVSMTLGLGYLVSSAFFIAFFALTAAGQIRAQSFHFALYYDAVGLKLERIS